MIVNGCSIHLDGFKNRSNQLPFMCNTFLVVFVFLLLFFVIFIVLIGRLPTNTNKSSLVSDSVEENVRYRADLRVVEKSKVLFSDV